MVWVHPNDGKRREVHVNVTNGVLFASQQQDVRGRSIRFRGVFPRLGTITIFLESSQPEIAPHLYDTIRIMGRMSFCTPAIFEAMEARLNGRGLQTPAAIRPSTTFDVVECFIQVHCDFVDTIVDAIAETMNELDTPSTVEKT